MDAEKLLALKDELETGNPRFAELKGMAAHLPPPPACTVMRNIRPCMLRTGACMALHEIQNPIVAKVSACSPAVHERVGQEVPKRN